jgi:2-polyprenyl-3-methyl-5-hydroxy-6-metoxy-1,4-benzoquinol methylase
MSGDRPTKLLENASRDISGAFATRFCAIGVELGLFKEIQRAGPISSKELAVSTKCNERYIREWIYGTALAGYIDFNKNTRKVSLNKEQKMLFVEEGGRFSQYGAFQVANSALVPYEELKEAFKNGRGLSFDTYPKELWSGLDHTGCTRYRNFLMKDWLPKLESIGQELEKGVVFADFGCGVGRSTIELAKEFPKSKFYGFDAYDKNIETASEYAAEAGVKENTEFKHWTVAEGSPGLFDVVATFDLIHDLPDPEDGIRVIRNSLKKGGTFLLMDIEATDDPMDNSGPLTLFKLGMSLHFCMTTAMWQGGEGMGTVGLSPTIINALCKKVGFTTIKKVNIEHPLNCLYEIS